MRIFWQSFIDAATSSSYLVRLSSYLNSIASPGTTVDVFGMTPPDRNFGRLSEFRCAVIAVDNGIEAEQRGYDGVVIGHFQDPGLAELKSALRIPIVGAGQASLLYASQLGRRLGLITLDDVFQVWHLEQADLYGLQSRVTHVKGLNWDPADFSAAFSGDETAKARMVEAFVGVAEPLVRNGVDVIVPAGVLPGLLVGGIRGLKVGHAPIVNTAAATLKSAEMSISLNRLDGIEVSRGPCYSLANEQAIDDFRRLVAFGRENTQGPDHKQ